MTVILMTTRTLLLVVCGCSVLLLQACSTEVKQNPPNIVFFLVDDLGWRDVASFGSTFYDTPNIDRLANEGIKFTNAYAASHVCSPTRASIMTGQNPARIGMTAPAAHLDGLHGGHADHCHCHDGARHYGDNSEEGCRKPP